MNAAEQLYDYLGKPRGQVVIFLNNKTPSEKELIVWVKQGYDCRKIPVQFCEYKVSIQEMPQAIAHESISKDLIIQ